MRDLTSFLILILALSIIPISIFAFIGIESILDSRIAEQVKFLAWWDHEKTKRSPEEFRKLLNGAYSYKITEAINDPDRIFYSKKQRRLESKILRRSITILLGFVSLIIFRMILNNLPGSY